MIIYFSGTGNTRHAALALASALGDDHVVELTGDVLLRPADFRCECTDSRVVWAFPTYSWGVPPVVVRFIKECRLVAHDALHHMVTTCGDDIGTTDRQWRRLMALRCWSTAGAYSVQMPNTYTLMRGFDVDSPQVEQAKLVASAPMLEQIARSIAAGSATTAVTRGSMAWLKSRVVYPWFVRFDMSPKPFHATNACIGCGRCAASCPMLNITMDSARPPRPRWSDQCALCLRCYHICPVHAVAYGRSTTKKGQYQHFLKKIEK